MGNLYRPVAPRFRMIDGLRGLAALAVVFHHAFALPRFGNVAFPRFSLSLEEFAALGKRTLAHDDQACAFCSRHRKQMGIVLD